MADPIVAIATAPGRGGVGVLRLSGPHLAPLAQALLGCLPTARVATYLPFCAADGSTIDRGLALYFPAPHSYTGEDVLELQAHGGPVVLQLLLERCLQAGTTPRPDGSAPAPGLRLARPGEFTERAYLNGKMDLAQAEAVADLIDASSAAAARSASRSLAGEFSAHIQALLQALIHLRMQVEATLDFPEEDIDFLRQADASGQLVLLRQHLEQVHQRTRQGALLREGLRVVIAGQPNVGKSSLLNALAGQDVAIVTDTPGTTRDVLRQHLHIDGVPLHVVDTAGLRESADPVERIGIARAWEQIAGADVLLFVHDLGRAQDSAYQAQDQALGAAVDEALRRAGAHTVPTLHVWNKLDTAPTALPKQPASASATAGAGGDTLEPITLSARTGEGLPALRQQLLRLAGWQAAPEGVYMARQRHVQALQKVEQHLAQASAHLATPQPALDLLAEELRLAQNALGQITGAYSNEDLLGEIFSRFCIGK